MSHGFAGCASMGRSIFPTSVSRMIFQCGSVAGWRTFLGVPLRQQGELIGALNARRNEVRPFTPAQIKLLETFADQAVIAIENVRLFQELKESLEQQTATSEILGVIASSPTDIQPVLDVVADNAARLCDADDATDSACRGRRLSGGGLTTEPSRYCRDRSRPIDASISGGRAVVDRQMVHIEDLAFRARRGVSGSAADRAAIGSRTMLRRHYCAKVFTIGVISIRRVEVRPFTDKQIAAPRTFADQAVIAIENVRLFKELRSAIANSPRRWSSRPPRARSYG